MRVLVTGGAGYIGSVVAEELLSAGHKVVVYDNLSKGHRDAVPDTAGFVGADLLDEAALLGALTEHRIEAVVHMAADSLVGESVTHPSKYYRSNLVVGLALLDAMRSVGSKILVFSSTAAVYGDLDKQPIEESDPLCPTNPYGGSKLAFEQALPWYEQAYGMRHISLRYFNAAGATRRSGERHDPETHLIPLVLQVAEGRRPFITIFGDDYPTRDGTCVRDYIHVSDLARAHVMAVEALAAGRSSGIYNLGCGGDGYSVREVIDIAVEVTGRAIPVSLGARRPGDPSALVAASDRIVCELGWRPRHQNLHAIIDSAWRWIERRPLAETS